MEERAGEPLLTARMHRAADVPPLGPVRDPVPDGAELERLLSAVHALRDQVDASPLRRNARGVLRTFLLRASGRPPALDRSLLEAIDALYDGVSALNHQMGAHAARLSEHEERLRRLEVWAEEAELRTPHTGTS